MPIKIGRGCDCSPSGLKTYGYNACSMRKLHATMVYKQDHIGSASQNNRCWSTTISMPLASLERRRLVYGASHSPVIDHSHCQTTAHPCPDGARRLALASAVAAFSTDEFWHDQPHFPGQPAALAG